MNFDGSNLIVGTNEGLLFLNCESLEVRKSLKVHNNKNIYCVNEFSSEIPHIIVSGGSEGDINIYDLEKDENKCNFKPHESWVWDTCQIPNSNLHASIADDNLVKFWNHHSGEIVFEQKIEQRNFSLITLPQQNIISVTGDGSTYLLDYVKRKIITNDEIEEDSNYFKFCGGFFAFHMPQKNLILISTHTSDGKDRVVAIDIREGFKTTFSIPLQPGNQIFSLCGIDSTDFVSGGGHGGDYTNWKLWDIRTRKLCKDFMCDSQVERVMDLKNGKEVMVGTHSGVSVLSFDGSVVKDKRRKVFDSVVYAMQLVDCGGIRLKRLSEEDRRERLEYLYGERYRAFFVRDEAGCLGIVDYPFVVIKTNVEIEILKFFLM